MTLLILAAGMGSRYGGIKQIEPVGANGELIIDYSIYDAIRAGFDKVVFIIRKDIEKDFKERIFDRMKGRIKCEYVFQEKPEWRERPFGTTDAVLSAKKVINEPFCIINADDYYGSEAFQKAFTVKGNAIVAYDLACTLPAKGSVTRGIVTIGKNNFVHGILDHRDVKITDIPTRFPHGTKANMNFFVLEPNVMPMLEVIRNEFLKNLGQDPKKECILPESLGTLAHEGKIKLKVYDSADNWFGLTNPEDLEIVRQEIAKLTRAGKYPSPLWK